MCFKQEGAIFILSGSPLKFVDKFTYHDSYISSTESDINIRLAKAWISIDHMEIWFIR